MGTGPPSTGVGEPPAVDGGVTRLSEPRSPSSLAIVVAEDVDGETAGCWGVGWCEGGGVALGDVRLTGITVVPPGGGGRVMRGGVWFEEEDSSNCWVGSAVGAGWVGGVARGGGIVRGA